MWRIATSLRDRRQGLRNRRTAASKSGVSITSRPPGSSHSCQSISSRSAVGRSKCSKTWWSRTSATLPGSYLSLVMSACRSAGEMVWTG